MDIIFIIGLIFILVTIIGMDGQVRKGNKQKEEIIDLLKQIKEKK